MNATLLIQETHDGSLLQTAIDTAKVFYIFGYTVNIIFDPVCIHKSSSAIEQSNNDINDSLEALSEFEGIKIYVNNDWHYNAVKYDIQVINLSLIHI